MDSYAVWITLFCCLSGWTHCVDYCQIKCQTAGGSVLHTMCTYTSQGPSCVGYKDDPLTKDEKKILVKKHNELRRLVAKGNEKRGQPGPQPSASNMIEMAWDNELAEIAQRWSDQCTSGHDKCRKVERFEVGQNYAYSATSGSAFQKEVDSLVQNWYDEVKDVASDTVTNFPGSSQGVVGHYTQLVWAESKLVGCGRTFYIDKGLKATALVCNYGPAGNMMGSGVYKQGKPCSACEGGATCRDDLCSYGSDDGVGDGGSCNARPELFLSILVSSLLIFITHYLNLD